MEKEIDWFEEWSKRGVKEGWVENDENYNKVFGETAPEGFKKWYIKHVENTKKIFEKTKE